MWKGRLGRSLFCRGYHSLLIGSFVPCQARRTLPTMTAAYQSRQFVRKTPCCSSTTSPLSISTTVHPNLSLLLTTSLRLLSRSYLTLSCPPNLTAEWKSYGDNSNAPLGAAFIRSFSSGGALSRADLSDARWEEYAWDSIDSASFWPRRLIAWMELYSDNSSRKCLSNAG